MGDGVHVRERVTRLKRRFPWWAKISGKLVLSRLPVPEQSWIRMGLFDPGPMDQPEYAVRVLQHHLARYPHPLPGGDLTALEIGPGKALTSAATAWAAGFSVIYLVDSKPLAELNIDALRRAAKNAGEVEGWRTPTVPPDADISETLRQMGAVYLADGLESMSQIADASVDFIWSQAVLEHIDRHEFREFARQLYRVLRPTGVASHTVDLQDHLGSSLNNLRFSRKVWESPIMRNSGFYTNRLRREEIIDAFESAGFVIEIPTTRRWRTLPLPRSSLATEFQRFTTDELRIAEFDLVVRKPSQSEPGRKKSSAALR